MNKILLAVFLTLSLAAQVPGVFAGANSEHYVAGLAHSGGFGQTYNTDFDDDQRGLKVFALSLADISIPYNSSPGESFHSNESYLDFRFAGLPLFKLHASLLI
jgi:hypothetical protein